MFQFNTFKFSAQFEMHSNQKSTICGYDVVFISQCHPVDCIVSVMSKDNIYYQLTLVVYISIITYTYIHTYIILSVDRIITHETVISLMITIYLHQGSQLKDFVMFSEIFPILDFSTHMKFFWFSLHSLADQYATKCFGAGCSSLNSQLAKNQCQHPNQFGCEEKNQRHKYISASDNHLQ